MTDQEYAEVAADPGSAFDDLLDAADYYPRLVARNPALSLELVVNPSAIDSLTAKDLAKLVTFEEAPSPLVELALQMVAKSTQNIQDLAQALLANRRLEPAHVKHVVWALADALDLNDTSVYHRQRYQDQKLPSPTQEVERVLCRLPLAELNYKFDDTDLVNSLVPRVYMRKRVGGMAGSAEWAAASTVTAPEVLAYLGQNKEFSMLHDKLARHARAPGSMLAAFVDHPWVTQSTVLRHPNLPAEVRQRIIQRGDPAQAAVLALNPSLTCDEQLDLIRRGIAAALPNLAETPHLCPEAARYIAALQNEELGLLLTGRTDLTDATVEELMQYPHDTVQYKVTERWNAAVERVWRKKQVPGRSRRRRRTKKEMEEAAKQNATQEPTAEAQQQQQNQNQARCDGARPPDLVPTMGLAQQLLVATSRNVDAQTLETLAGSLQAVVRLAVAAHPNASSETRAWLEEDTDVRVAAAAKVAPSLPV